LGAETFLIFGRGVLRALVGLFIPHISRLKFRVLLTDERLTRVGMREARMSCELSDIVARGVGGSGVWGGGSEGQAADQTSGADRKGDGGGSAGEHSQAEQGSASEQGRIPFVRSRACRHGFAVQSALATDASGVW